MTSPGSATSTVVPPCGGAWIASAPPQDSSSDVTTSMPREADPGGPAGARINLTIDAASLETGIEMRDKHLRSADFFDIERFPTIAFQSVRVESAGRRATVMGRLTLHGVTREIAVPVDVQITETALVASGEFIVNRGEYAMNYNSFLNPIGNEVRVAFTFRARVP